MLRVTGVILALRLSLVLTFLTHRDKMGAYEVAATDTENIGACSLCRYRPGRTEGHRRKRDRLKKRYAEGLRHKVQ